MVRHTLKEARGRILGEEWCAKAKGKNGRSPAPLVSETGRATSLVQLGQMKMPRLASKLAAGYIVSGRGHIAFRVNGNQPWMADPLMLICFIVLIMRSEEHTSELQYLMRIP